MSPASLSTPRWRPKLASLFEVVALRQLALPEIAAQRKRYLRLERERLLATVVIPTDDPLVELPASQQHEHQRIHRKSQQRQSLR